MYVDKERANKVLEYMRNVNAEWVSNGIQSASAALHDERARFSFHKFLAEKKLLNNAMSRNDDLWIECPFHDDASPSCSINEYKYVYHCFSCGSRGNLINLVKDYNEKFEKSGLGYYQILNNYLRTDKEMQASLGFDSIYINQDRDDFNFDDALKKFTFTKPVGKVLPSSYVELADLLVKQKADLKQIKLFIILMQNHVDVKEIYSEIFGESAVSHDTALFPPNDIDSSGEGAISIQKLLEF